MIRCPQCGSIDLVGGRYFRLVVRVVARLPCKCGMGAGGLAALRRYQRPTPMREWGRLDGSGDWVLEAAEESGSAEEEPITTNVYCPDCVADAEAADWNVRVERIDEDRLGQTPFQACNGCGMEQLIV